MDVRIREHADAIYVKEAQEIAAGRAREAKALAVRMSARGLSVSGIAQGNMIDLEAVVVGKQMMARLTSFQQAFADASVKPSLDDLSEIWPEVMDVYRVGIGSIKHRIEQRAIATGRAGGALADVEPIVAREHDRVLGEWKIWRTRVGLAGVQEAFSANRVLKLSELPRKQKLLDDLGRLLSTQSCGIAVLFIDLDNFKGLNDTHGHPAGDKCLEHLAQIIGSIVLHKGRLYRYASGDEFMIILPNLDEAEARATAERIRRTIEAEKPGESVTVTASIDGVVASKTTYDSAESVLKAADTTMYIAKKKKNAVNFG